MEDVAALVALGGPVFVILFVLSVVATALVLHKISMFARLRVGRHEAAQAAVSRWVRKDPRAALTIATQDPSPAATAVAHAIRGLMRDGSELALVKEDAARVASELLARLQTNLRPLEAISQVAPLLGLLGTVVGMIETFAAMERAGGAVVPADLAGGIWVALLTTGFGLAIAIPASALLVWFDGIVERERAAMESLLTSIFTGRPTDPEAVAEASVPDAAPALPAQ